jgi:hypothetical protein
MEHLYKSIAIKNYLICYFPLPDLAVELIINNLKLAIDLNGYTNDMLKNYIMLDFTNTIELNEYILSKYGKNRRTLSLLKKYQLIHIIQYFNVNIPLKPFKIDLLKKFQEDNNIILKTENNNIIFNINNIMLSVNTLIPINVNSVTIKKLFIYFKTIDKNNISNYILICKYNNDDVILIYNKTTKIDYNKIALLYYYSTVLNSNLSFNRERIRDELHIEMKKILFLIHENCSLFKVNNITESIFTKNDVEYILNNI